MSAVGHHAAQSFVRATALHFVGLTRERSEVVLTLVIPVGYASIAYFIHRSGDRSVDLRGLMAGAGLMGMWSTVLFGAGTAIRNQRMAGTLELLLMAPQRFATTLAPMVTANACFGALAVVATFAWGAIAFGATVAPTSIPVLALVVLVTAAAMGAFSLLVAALFVQVRRAESLAAPLLAPLWIISGVLVPAALPQAIQPVAALFPMTWGAQALRGAATGAPWSTALLWCTLVGAVHALIGSYLVNLVARTSRSRGELHLW
ncbi:ABC transporter permease [Streptomyces sp. NPDC023327]|uniref:ABC transporter permease n=1 Tax=Streptomyces sp. NPDC023327 TaxID=3157088 RepID=UPI0033E3E23F